jgi:hypothetical protein
MFSTSATALIQLVLCMTGVMTVGLGIALIVYTKMKRDEQTMLDLAEYDTAGEPITGSK